jgi:predicted ester cyclase
VLIGRDAYRDGILRRIAAFPDYHVTIVEILAEDDQVMIYWTNQGTHLGVFRGIPPTGNIIREAAISIYRVRNGMIAEVRGLSDNLDFLTQLGVASL